MSAWGHGSFENDDAVDWVFDLGESDGFSALTGAFAAVRDDPEQHVELDASNRVVAAAEVVATLLGKPPAVLPDEVQLWAEGRPAPGADVVADARRAVKHVLYRSDLREAKEPTKDVEAWTQGIENLLERLA